jgi:hypothetical protein
MRAFALLLAFTCALATATATRSAAQTAPAPLPPTLSATGLFATDAPTTVRDGVIAFSPQYPLWSDGTRKRRWIALPPGISIDAAQADAWVFPPGTRLWKEFAFERRVETRYVERLADGRWRFATYVWRADGSDADLAPEGGTVVAVAGAPGGKYAVPSRTDCLACHEGAAVPVLGFSALQLSPDRDPLAPHAEPARPELADLRSLAARGLLQNLSPALLTTPPRIAARSPVERAALGYLHGNCGHCHNAAGALDGLEMVLAQQADPRARSAEQTLQSLLGHSSRFRPQGAATAQRIARDGATHMLTLRMKSASPLARMPPLGVQVIDDEGVSLVERWITQDLNPTGRTP